ncbi:putative salivary gland protein 10 [Frankliniella occidentalis]|uniref:Uncharacterized protein LOC113217380 isoform X2 n=1 Tax=Frankliniella occidentalis TaxID=133901 RepID=A0A6J1THR8_FRAOC|nr:uncharacterized protein LOC113217380 isoform X2 [Frankliniella occidentalis]KAE8740695.1 putative salivary gland protein 10 [Frankliniella occidentalis]
MSSAGVQSPSDDTEDQSQSPSLNKLCDDALILVLRLLGCGDLQRCRLVCRRWRDLVQHPDVWRHRAMELLPNGFLILVMRYFDIRELLPLRLVCRRWRDLAMHPGVWRYLIVGERHLSLRPPCCGELRLSSENPLSLAATAMCPAALVYIYIPDGGANEALLQVVRHQAGLGNLRCIWLTVRDPFVYNNFDVVLSVEGLRELEVRQFCKTERLSIFKRSCFPAAAPSLRKLTYEGGPGSDPFLESLLQAVALSLEDLDLLFCTEFDNFHSDMTVARLLSKCNNLRKLRCPFLGGFEQLLACRSLTDLEISTVVDAVQGSNEEDARCAISSLCCFLRSAPHLTHLSFWFDNFETATDLFRALDGAGRSQITSLKVRTEVNWTKEQADRLWELVVPILPNFPRLEELTADLMVTPHLLRAIRPNLLPNVTRLNVMFLDRCFNCNWDLLCEMLQIYPRLQINIEFENLCHCRQCSKPGGECHELLKRRPGFQVNYLRKNAAKNRVNCDGVVHMWSSDEDDDDNDNVDF